MMRTVFELMIGIGIIAMIIGGLLSVMAFALPEDDIERRATHVGTVACVAIGGFGVIGLILMHVFSR